MKHFYSIIIMLFIFSTCINAWEWKGIKSEMTYEEATKILGKAISIESSTDKSQYSSTEYVSAKYNYQGYELIVTFSRTHEVNSSLGFSFEKYDSAIPFTVSALIVRPGKNKLSLSEIHSQFGQPKKIGRHIMLGLREDYENGAKVDYSYLDDTRVLEIKYGYIK